MKQWDKINWPILNRRARENEVKLGHWSPAHHALKEKGVAASITQTDDAAIRALMVWCDDGGSQENLLLSRQDLNVLFS